MMKKSLLFYESRSRRSSLPAILQINEKGIETKLSERIGTNQASFNPRVLILSTNTATAMATLLVTVWNAKGKVIPHTGRQCYAKSTNRETDLPQRIFTCPNHAGDQMNGYILKPTNFDLKRYPISHCRNTVAGSQSVLDKWTIDWEYYLVNEGFIVAVDGREPADTQSGIRNLCICRIGETRNRRPSSGSRDTCGPYPA